MYSDQKPDNYRQAHYCHFNVRAVVQVTQLRLIHLFDVLYGKRLFVKLIAACCFASLYHVCFKFPTPWLIGHCYVSYHACILPCIFTEDLYLSVSWYTLYLRREQGVEWCVNKAKTRRPWILRIYRSCLAGDLLFATFTAETVNLSADQTYSLSLFRFIYLFQRQSSNTSLVSLFVFFSFCQIMTTITIASF